MADLEAMVPGRRKPLRVVRGKADEHAKELQIMRELAELVGVYYKALLDQGIPQDQAMRFAQDWHAAVLLVEDDEDEE